VVEHREVILDRYTVPGGSVPSLTKEVHAPVAGSAAAQAAHHETAPAPAPAEHTVHAPQPQAGHRKPKM
jgi:hypothetical protein